MPSFSLLVHAHRGRPCVLPACLPRFPVRIAKLCEFWVRNRTQLGADDLATGKLGADSTAADATATPAPSHSHAYVHSQSLSLSQSQSQPKSDAASAPLPALPALPALPGLTPLAIPALTANPLLSASASDPNNGAASQLGQPHSGALGSDTASQRSDSASASVSSSQPPSAAVDGAVVANQMVHSEMGAMGGAAAATAAAGDATNALTPTLTRFAHFKILQSSCYI